MKRPEFPIKSFSYANELLQEYSAWDLELSKSETGDLKNVLGRTSALLTDIGLSPDRSYSVEDISRLKTAVLWALGG